MASILIKDLAATESLDREASRQLRGGLGFGNTGGTLPDPKKLLAGINVAFAAQVAFAFNGGGGPGPVIDQFTGIQF